MMDTYYLTMNMMYDAKHVKKKRWYHFLFGRPSTMVDVCMAYSEREALSIFIGRGHDFGCLHDSMVKWMNRANTNDKP